MTFSYSRRVNPRAAKLTQSSVTLSFVYPQDLGETKVFSNKLRSSIPASLGLPTWRGYQAHFNGRCVVFITYTDVCHRFIVSFGTRRAARRRYPVRVAIVQLENWNKRDQPLPLNSAVDLSPWVHFSLGFLTSFGSMPGQECFALSPLYEEKTRIPKNRLNQVKSVK